MAHEVKMSCSTARGFYYADNEPKKVYALFDIVPTDAVSHITMPLNLALVLDRSGSMTGEKIENLKKAVHLVIDRLGAHDQIAMISFDDVSEIPIHSQKATKIGALKGAVDSLTPRNGTQMSLGMKDGMDQLLTANVPDAVSRMILLTDGQTWGDDELCLEIAGQCQERGIPITALGLGNDWNEKLLTGIADKTVMHGGMAAYLNDPADIATAFTQSVAIMQACVVRNSYLTIRLVKGITPQRVWRVSPLLSELSPAVMGERDIQVPLGDLERGVGQSVLVELVTQSRPTGVARLAQASLTYDVPTTGVTGAAVESNLVVTFVNDLAQTTHSDARVEKLVQEARVHQLKTRALQSEQDGDLTQAARFTRQAATMLLGSGDAAGAQTLQNQTVLLEQGQETSTEYKKEVKMGQATVRLTRRLGQ